MGSITWDDHQAWCCDIKESGSAETRSGVWLSDREEFALTGSRGHAHFVVKFDKQAKKEAYCTVVPSKKITSTYIANGEWQPVLMLDCRGLEPTAWKPSSEVQGRPPPHAKRRWDRPDLPDIDLPRP